MKEALRDILAEKLDVGETALDLSTQPSVILVIGVNGVGKTTTIAKLAALYKKQGRRVMLAAGDTFRAAASEQLELWADRAGVPLVQAGQGIEYRGLPTFWFPARATTVSSCAVSPSVLYFPPFYVPAAARVQSSQIVHREAGGAGLTFACNRAIISHANI